MRTGGRDRVASPARPARVDTDEWQLDDRRDGRVLVTNLQPARDDVRARAAPRCTASSVDGGIVPEIRGGIAMTRALISADNHVFEPVTLWQERLPAGFRERGPRSSSATTGS